MCQMTETPAWLHPVSHRNEDEVGAPAFASPCPVCCGVGVLVAHVHELRGLIVSCNCCGQRYVAPGEDAPPDVYFGDVALATLDDIAASSDWDAATFFVLPRP
jgi:hypothetical protein